MKLFLISTAVMEIGAGAGLVIAPSPVTSLLVGAPLEGPVALTVARVAAGALLSLGAACWLARNDAESAAARGLVAAALVYNTATVAVLFFGSMAFGLSSMRLWSTVALHAAMAFWGGACLRRPARQARP